jgi:hypothetical protein
VVPPASWSISEVLQAEGVSKAVADNWNDIPHEEFFKLLIQAVTDERNVTNIALTEMAMKDRLKDIRFRFNLRDFAMKPVLGYIDRVNTVLHQFQHIHLSKEAEKLLLKEVLYKTIGDNKNLEPPDLRLREEIQKYVPSTISEFLIAFKRGFKEIVSHLQEYNRIHGITSHDKNRGGDRDKNRGGEYNNRDKNRGGGDNRNKRDKNRGHKNNNYDKNHGEDGSTDKNIANKRPQSTDDATCDVCGRNNHESSDCYMKFHPNANKSNSKWVDSHFGKLFAERDPSTKTLPLRYDINGNKVTIPPDVKERLVAMGKSSHGKRRRGELNEEYLFKCSLINKNLPLYKGLNINALLDTGALESNYISKDVEEKLIKDGAKGHKCNKLVCSGFKTCTSCLGSYNVLMKLIIKMK